MSENEPTGLWTRIFLFLVVIDLTIILLAVIGRMLFDWQPLTAFYPFFYGAQLALALAAAGLIQTLYGLFKNKAVHLKTGATTLVLGLLPLAASLLAVGVSGFRAPMIHDISTDMLDPPAFSIISSLRTAEENSLDYAGESVASLQRLAYPDVKPLLSALATDEARQKALTVAENLDWTVVVSDESLGQIEAYDTSGVFGFIDDVVIRIRPDGTGSRIDLRSVSRVGVGDLGANAARIRLFQRNFES